MICRKPSVSNTELDVLEDAGRSLEAVAGVDVRRRQVDEHVPGCRSYAMKTRL